jgi:vacuolar protein sorting-associated protein 26
VESGYEDAVQIEFELSQLKTDFRDVLLGRIYFHIIRVRLVTVTVQIVRHEILGTGKNQRVLADTIAEYEILDGPVAKGDCIPIRIFLRSCKITPSYYNISNRAAVRYYAKLFLQDEDGRTFAKMQEIVLWRAREKPARDGISAF